MTQKIDILVVIVNYRTPTLTIDALGSLAIQKCENLFVVVANAPSGDNSQQQITDAIKNKNWSSWIDFVQLDHNGGFAYGNNVGIKHILDSNNPPKYVLLLNPDTVVCDGAINCLYKFLEANPKAGLVGSRLEDPDGTPQASAFRFPGIISEFVSTMRFGMLSKLLSKFVLASPIKNIPHQTGWVAGASVLIRSEIFQQIGLLDEKFFLYYEEVEFCLRAKRAGWQCWYEPKSQVVHLVGAASGISDTRKKAPRRPTYWFESRRRYYIQSYGKMTAILADTAWLLGYSLWSLRRFIQRKPNLDPPKFLIDFFKNSVFYKGFDL